MAANIGSGVSIILFTAPQGKFERVGGTSLGGNILYDVGSTFLGMCLKLLGIDDFEKLIEMAVVAGDTQGVDLLFKDYYSDEQGKLMIDGKERFVGISLAEVAQMTPEQAS